MKRKHTTGREVSLLRKESDRLRREVSRLQTDNVELQSEVFRLAVPLAHAFCMITEQDPPNVNYRESLFLVASVDLLWKRLQDSFSMRIDATIGKELEIFGNRALIRGQAIIMIVKRDMRIGDARKCEMFNEFGFTRISIGQAFCAIERISPEELNQ